MNMYYVALVLPDELNRRIQPMKEWMHEQFGCMVGLKSPAHITLLPPFRMNAALEPELVDALKAFAATQTPPDICTRGFSSFKKRTLFIDVLVDEALAALKKACDAWFRERQAFGIKLESRPFHPHITIATRDIPDGAFAIAWERFGKTAFQECWRADAISLMKHNGRSWDVWREAPIGNPET